MNDEVSLMILKLKERIIKNLEDRYRKTGMNDAVSWRGIWIELGGTEEDFYKALQAAAESRGQAEIVFTDSDHIKLPAKAGFKTEITHASGVSLKPGPSQQACGLTATFIRFFLTSLKKKPGRFESNDASSI